MIVIRGLLCIGVLLAAAGPAAAQWSFTDVTADAGLAYEHGFASGPLTDVDRMIGGAAAADVDGDGLLDLYVLRGPAAPDLLLRNRGDGSFEPFATQPTAAARPASGPLFADLDGDGWVDLVVGALRGAFSPPETALYRNTGGGVFVEEPGGAGLSGPPLRHVFSLAAGDHDRDGDLDLAAAHWTDQPIGVSLRRNDGGLAFTDVTGTAGIYPGAAVYGFTPNFVDLDGDGWPDLAVAADFGTSVVYLNDGDGTFTNSFDPTITDENGMGAAVADYDRDGDLDWFVSSIWDPDGDSGGLNWGVSGNRLYRNDGDGTFDDRTDVEGVREGWWGWGSCFADFDNDGRVDLFHTNGWSPSAAPEFHADPSRLFVARTSFGFDEASAARGIVDTDQGRGVVCFDYDRDGDLDLLVANNDGPLRLFRNDGGNANRSLTVRLAGDPPNTAGVGARVSVTAGGVTQVAVIRAGSNYASTDPAEAHFGLGTATTVDEVRVDWPLGGTSVRTAVAADRLLTVSASPAPPPTVPPTHTAAKLDAAGDALRLDWDAAGCGGATGHRVLWGYGASLPASAGDARTVDGAVCGVGVSGSHTWSTSPDPAADPGGLVWWLVVADDAALTEGGWGAGRRGTGPFGASGLCGAVRRDLSAGCAP